MPSGDFTLWGEIPIENSDESVASSHRINTGELRISILRYWLSQGWQPMEYRMALAGPNGHVVCNTPPMQCEDFWRLLFQEDLIKHWEAEIEFQKLGRIIKHHDYITNINFLRINPKGIVSKTPTRYI
jgi:hypothetical protein